MAPKVTTQPAKLTSILSYFRKSAVAHSIKDLEKALPSVASINSMAVKDYLAALTDENKIRVEKIGSGNWYWAFAGEEKRAREVEMEKARAQNEEMKAEVLDLKERVEEAERAKEEESGEETEALMQQREALELEVRALKEELEVHKDSDPLEMGRKLREVQDLKGLAEKWSDHVLSLESYLKGIMGMDKDSLMGLKRQVYGEEFDEEDGGLREL